MVHVKLDTDKIMKSVNRYVENISKIDTNAAVAAALDEAADILLEQMQEAVYKHHRKENAYKSIKRTEVEIHGNYISVEVGALFIRSVDKKGFHVIYQEYGSPTFAADPWLRSTLEKSRTQIKATIIAVMKGWGVTNAVAA